MERSTHPFWRVPYCIQQSDLSGLSNTRTTPPFFIPRSKPVEVELARSMQAARILFVTRLDTRCHLDGRDVIVRSPKTTVHSNLSASQRWSKNSKKRACRPTY